MNNNPRHPQCAGASQPSQQQARYMQQAPYNTGVNMAQTAMYPQQMGSYMNNFGQGMGISQQSSLRGSCSYPQVPNVGPHVMQAMNSSNHGNHSSQQNFGVPNYNSQSAVPCMNQNMPPGYQQMSNGAPFSYQQLGMLQQQQVNTQVPTSAPSQQCTVNNSTSNRLNDARQRLRNSLAPIQNQVNNLPVGQIGTGQPLPVNVGQQPQNLAPRPLPGNPQGQTWQPSTRTQEQRTKTKSNKSARGRQMSMNSVRQPSAAMSRHANPPVETYNNSRPQATTHGLPQNNRQHPSASSSSTSQTLLYHLMTQTPNAVNDFNTQTNPFQSGIAVDRVPTSTSSAANDMDNSDIIDLIFRQPLSQDSPTGTLPNFGQGVLDNNFSAGAQPNNVPSINTGFPTTQPSQCNNMFPTATRNYTNKAPAPPQSTVVTDTTTAAQVESRPFPPGYNNALITTLHELSYMPVLTSAQHEGTNSAPTIQRSDLNAAQDQSLPALIKSETSSGPSRRKNDPIYVDLVGMESPSKNTDLDDRNVLHNDYVDSGTKNLPIIHDTISEMGISQLVQSGVLLGPVLNIVPDGDADRQVLSITPEAAGTQGSKEAPGSPTEQLVPGVGCSALSYPRDSCLNSGSSGRTEALENHGSTPQESGVLEDSAKWQSPMANEASANNQLLRTECGSLLCVTNVPEVDNEQGIEEAILESKTQNISSESAGLVLQPETQSSRETIPASETMEEGQNCPVPENPEEQRQTTGEEESSVSEEIEKKKREVDTSDRACGEEDSSVPGNAKEQKDAMPSSSDVPDVEGHSRDKSVPIPEVTPSIDVLPLVPPVSVSPTLSDGSQPGQNSELRVLLKRIDPKKYTKSGSATRKRSHDSDSGKSSSHATSRVIDHGNLNKQSSSSLPVKAKVARKSAQLPESDDDHDDDYSPSAPEDSSDEWDASKEGNVHKSTSGKRKPRRTSVETQQVKDSRKTGKSITNQSTSTKQKGNSSSSRTSVPTESGIHRPVKRSRLQFDLIPNVNRSTSSALETCTLDKVPEELIGLPFMRKTMHKGHRDNLQLYQCLLCSHTHSTQNEVARHTLERHSSLLYLTRVDVSAKSTFLFCRHCDFVAPSQLIMWKHFSVEHKVQDIYHYRKLDNIKQPGSHFYLCTKCSSTTRSKAEIEKHCVGKHSDAHLLYVCSTCSVFMSFSLENLVSHTKEEHADMRPNMFATTMTLQGNEIPDFPNRRSGDRRKSNSGDDKSPRQQSPGHSSKHHTGKHADHDTHKNRESSNGKEHKKSKAKSSIPGQVSKRKDRSSDHEKRRSSKEDEDVSGKDDRRKKHKSSHHDRRHSADNEKSSKDDKRKDRKTSTDTDGSNGNKVAKHTDRNKSTSKTSCHKATATSKEKHDSTDKREKSKSSMLSVGEEAKRVATPKDEKRTGGTKTSDRDPKNQKPGHESVTTKLSVCKDATVSKQVLKSRKSRKSSKASIIDGRGASSSSGEDEAEKRDERMAEKSRTNERMDNAQMRTPERKCPMLKDGGYGHKHDRDDAQYQWIRRGAPRRIFKAAKATESESDGIVLDQTFIRDRKCNAVVITSKTPRDGSDISYQCTLCPDMFTSMDLVLQHISKSHAFVSLVYNKEKETCCHMVCFLCDYVTKDPMAMSIHFFLHHKVSDIMGPYGVQTDTHDGVVQRFYTCLNCHFITDALFEILVHCIKKHGSRFISYKCPLCQTFSDVNFAKFVWHSVDKHEIRLPSLCVVTLSSINSDGSANVSNCLGPGKRRITDGNIFSYLQPTGHSKNLNEKIQALRKASKPVCTCGKAKKSVCQDKHSAAGVAPASRTEKSSTRHTGSGRGGPNLKDTTAVVSVTDSDSSDGDAVSKHRHSASKHRKDREHSGASSQTSSTVSSDIVLINDEDSPLTSSAPKVQIIREYTMPMTPRADTFVMEVTED